MSQFQKTDHDHDAKSASNVASSTSDRGVLLSACELFVSRERHDAVEKHVFEELALNLLPKATLSDRRRISSLLARHAETPEALLVLLAKDEDPLTAYSVLRFASNIPMKILLDIIERGPDSLRQAIGERPVLTEQIVEGICRFGGENVVQRLLARPGIDRFIKKPQPRIKPGEDGSAYVENITRDTKQTPNALMRDFFDLDRKLRGKAVAAAEMSAIVSKASGAPTPPTDENRDEDFISIVVKKALCETPLHAVELLAQSIHLPKDHAHKIAFEDNGDSLAILLRSCGFSEEEATTVIVRTLGERRTLIQLRPVLTLFRNISLSAAKMLVGQWSKAEGTARTPAPIGHQPVHSEAVRAVKAQTVDVTSDGDLIEQKPFGRRSGFKAS